ncbi:MAG: DUF5677 domain-containing protein [Bacilli bacterium]
MSEKLTYNEIACLLDEDFENEAERKEKCQCFQDLLVKGYSDYKKQAASDQEIVAFSEFSLDVFARHKRNIGGHTLDFKRTYHRDKNYLNALVKDSVQKLNEKATATYIFKVQNENVADIDILINKYVLAIRDRLKEGEFNTVSGQLMIKALNKFSSGIHLITRNFIDEALIIWRSFLEDVTIVKILRDNQDKKLESKFLTNKERTLVDLGFINENTPYAESVSDQSRAHIADRRANYWEILRFSWIGNLLKENDYTSNDLRKLAKLDEYSVHYKFTSVFVHERLISDEDVQVLPLNDYALYLFWKLFDEQLRTMLIAYFKLDDNLKVDKSEKAIRKYLRLEFNERFKELAGIIAK